LIARRTGRRSPADSAADLAYIEAETVFDVARPMEAAFHLLEAGDRAVNRRASQERIKALMLWIIFD
jgi:hypothetical protein